MERFAADNLKAERDDHIRASIKANVPWTELVETYGITVEQIMEISQGLSGLQQRGSAIFSKPPDPRDRFKKPMTKDAGWHEEGGGPRGR